ncbi:hypothetical protein D3C76_1609290 [compost metagenome]
MVFGVVARMNHRHHHKTLAGQGRGQVVQGQRRAGVAMGQQQHRKPADSDFGVFAGFDVVPLKQAGMFLGARRIEGNGTHRLQVERVEKAQFVITDAPVRMRRRRGVH